MEKLRGIPLYFVGEGKVKMETGRVHVVKRIQLKALFEGINAIDQRILDAKQLGNDTVLDKQLEKVREELTAEAESLHEGADKLSQLVGGGMRSKRGALDIGGDVLKFMFGTMNSKDAKEITDKFNELNEGQQLIEKQMSSTVAVMDNLNEANLIIRQNQMKEEAAVKRMWGELTNYMGQETQREDIREMHNSLSRWILALKMEVGNLHNALMFLKAGVVDPYIVDRKEMRDKASGMGLGYDVGDSDIGQLYAAANFSSFLNSTSETVYIIMGLPVAGNSSFELYSVNKVPQRIEGKKVIIEGVDKFLLMSEDRRSYWKGESFEHAKIGNIVMTKPLPMMAIRDNNCCEVMVFQFSMDKGCNYIEWEMQLEVEIIVNGGYIMSWFQERQVSFTCGKEKGNLTIDEPTWVQIREGCAIAGDGFAIEGVSEQRVVDLHDLAIKVECCSNFDVNGTVGELPGNLSWDDKNITNSEEQIKALKETLGEYKNKRIETFIIMGVPTGIFIVVIIIIVAIWYVRVNKGRAIVDRVAELAAMRNQHEMDIHRWW